MAASSSALAEALGPFDSGPEKSRGLVETEKFIAREFLGEEHCKGIYEALASRWDRLHSLSAAMKLMEDYGVKLTPEEEQRISKMDEGQQINQLVMKMPQQSNEQFQQFFLQLQLLVSTATRIRRSLQEGRPDRVEEALNEAEHTGIAQYILRLAIVQAGSEVALLREQYLAWLKDIDLRCGKLIRGQEDCRNAQMKLAAAQAQLSTYTAGQNEKSKKVMMNFAAQSDKGLVSSMFFGWKGFVKQEKLEAEVRKEYADQLESLEKQMAALKESRLGGIRGMMMKKGMQNDTMLMQEVLRCWRVETKEFIEVTQNQHKMKEMEEKLNTMKSSQMANTKRVMMRMNADSEYALLGQTFAAFVTHHRDYHKDLEFNQKVAESEKMIKQFQETQSAGAKKVLEKMGGSTDSGLVQQTFHAWREEWEDAKKEAEMEAVIHGQNQKLAAFTNRTRDSGKNTLDRGRGALEQGIMLKVLGAWRLDTRMEATLRVYHAKIEAKRSQLVGVQHMFRRFAGELEGSFKPDTGRDIRDGPPPGKMLRRDSKMEGIQERYMIKGDGSMSLPDIKGSGRTLDRKQQPAVDKPQQKPLTPGSSKVRTPTHHSPPPDGSPVPQPRHAWH